MTTAVRDARLRGAKAAHAMLRASGAREKIVQNDGQIDVFGALAARDIIVMFRPLKGLLGAYLRGAPAGVLINTQRPLTVQRFTAAHELGHAVMNHKPSIDTPDVLRRAALGRMGSSDKFDAFLQEVEADAFAGDYLLPRWLLAHHAERQSWSGSDFSNPNVAYQLAIRCGVSLDATTRALERNQLVSRQSASQIRKIKPKDIKASIRSIEHSIDPWADAWLLTEKDEGTTVPLQVGDVITVRLAEYAAAGYLWESLEIEDLTKIADGRDPSEIVGGVTSRFLGFRADASGTSEIKITERRPWEAKGRDVKFRLAISPKQEGLLRTHRGNQV